MTKRRTTTTKSSSNNQGGVRVHQLSNGDYVVGRLVSPFLVDALTAKVPDPKPPMMEMEDGELYPNTNDPGFHEAKRKAEAERQTKMVQAVALFGLTLSDADGNPIDPPDTNWELSLKMVGIDWKSELGDLADFETKDEETVARKAAYLIFCAIAAPDIPFVLEQLGIDEGRIEEVEAMFQRSET